MVCVSRILVTAYKIPNGCIAGLAFDFHTFAHIKP